MQNGAEIVCKMVQKLCAKTALFVYQKRCCKVMQMNTLRMLPRARVNKQTNEQTNKTPIGVREKVDRKDEDEEENFEVTFVPVFG